MTKGGEWVVRGGGSCSGIFPEASIGVLLEASDSLEYFVLCFCLLVFYLRGKEGSVRCAKKKVF
jgi:hypothetical protein